MEFNMIELIFKWKSRRDNAKSNKVRFPKKFFQKNSGRKLAAHCNLPSVSSNFMQEILWYMYKAYLTLKEIFLYSILPNHGSIRHTLFCRVNYHFIFPTHSCLDLCESVCVFSWQSKFMWILYFPQNIFMRFKQGVSYRNFLLDVFDFFFASFATAEQNMNNSF